MGREVAQHPAAAVEEHKYRQCFLDLGRSHNVQQDILPLDMNGFLADFDLVQWHFDATLRALQHFARLFRFHLFHRLATAGIQRIQKGADIMLCGRLGGIYSFLGHHGSSSVFRSRSQCS
ncbi:hypothetical protein D3C73_1084100 [compost metagenome]